ARVEISEIDDMGSASEYQSIGKTPIDKLPYPPGVYSLKFAHDNYESLEKTIPVVEGESPEVQANLVRKSGHIRVTSQPRNASIYLDGKRLDHTTPYVIQNVPTGAHKIRIERDDYDIHLESVNLEYNQTHDINVTLSTAGTEAWKAKRTRARLFSIIPGGGQFTTEGQWWRGVLYTGGIAAAGLLAWNADQDYNNAETRYLDAQNLYHASVTQTQIDSAYTASITTRNDMIDANNQFNQYLILAGGIYVVQMLDAWFFGGGAKPVSYEITAFPQQPYLSVTQNQSSISIDIFFLF
ncbi:PEGA domain-containing protein, partial [bacterium]|nr:PEGA domain-containing protein [bacterium]